MSYSNDQTQIRSGLVNYIGALVNSSPFEDRAARQNVASILTEEAIKIAQDKDGIIDLYTIKPLLRGCSLIFRQRCSELGKLPQKDKHLEEIIMKYNNLAEIIDGLISEI